MLNKSKKILLISASLIALSGSAAVFAAPADDSRALVAEQVQQQVNINSAPAAEIASVLKGIGLKKAQAIVAYRDAHGAFFLFLRQVPRIASDVQDRFQRLVFYYFLKFF